MRTLTLIILLIIWPSAAYSWQWRITERGNTNVTCVNGQCVAAPKARILSQQPPLVKESLPVKQQASAPAATESLSFAQGNSRSGGAACPDGRCPLLPKQGSRSQVPSISNTPTLATPEPKVIVQAKPLRSVMVQPVRRAIQWRPFKRLFGRR